MISSIYISDVFGWYSLSTTNFWYSNDLIFDEYFDDIQIILGHDLLYVILFYLKLKTLFY